MVTVHDLLEKGVLIDPEVLQEGIEQSVLDRAVELYGDELLVIDKALLDSLQERPAEISVLWSYDKPAVKRTYEDFVKVLNIRFEKIEQLLKARQELSNTISISRVRVKKDREPVAIIAMIIEKSTTANGNLLFHVEDRSGQIKVIISPKSKMFEEAKDIQLDEVLGFIGQGAHDIIFADQFYYPDIPLTKELKKSPNEEYAVFIGDPHFGSKVFLKEDFQRLLLWLNAKVGNDEQKAIAKNVRYVFVTGDLIEGVGIYPSQEQDLAIPDITQQYEEAARYLAQIPSHMHIIIYPGNHDAGRLSEPQEPLMKEYAQSIYDLPNTLLVSNPAMIRIGTTPTFQGFDCLLYHGGSFIYYSDNIPSIRAAGGQKRVDLIMKYLLQRRHLVPTHNAWLTVPTTDRDYLLIDHVPDFFITGHIHRTSINNYRNVTMINSGCWTETTEDQIKRGLEPQPAKLIIINLNTRDVKVMNFRREEKNTVAEENL